MEGDRAVRVEGALRLPCRAARVAHGGGGRSSISGPGGRPRSRSRRGPRTRSRRPGVGPSPIATTCSNPTAPEVLSTSGHSRTLSAISTLSPACVAMYEVVGMQAEVERVRDHAAHRDARGRSRGAGSGSSRRSRRGRRPRGRARAQRSRQLRARARTGVRVAVPAAVGEARDDLAVAEELLAPAEDRRHVQLVVHDQAFHSAPCSTGAAATRRRAGDSSRPFRSSAATSARSRVPEPARLWIPSARLYSRCSTCSGEADAAQGLDRRLADEQRRRPRMPSPPRPPPTPAGRPSRRTRTPRARASARARAGCTRRRAGGTRPGRRRSASRTARATPRTRSRARAPSRPTPHASIAKARRERASISGRTVESASRAPGSPPRTTPSGRVASVVVRIPARTLELVDPVTADDRDAVGRVEVGDERPEGERPASPRRRRPRPQVVRERGQRDGEGREEGPW